MEDNEQPWGSLVISSHVLGRIRPRLGRDYVYPQHDAVVVSRKKNSEHAQNGRRNKKSEARSFKARLFPIQFLFLYGGELDGDIIVYYELSKKVCGIHRPTYEFAAFKDQNMTFWKMT